METVEALWGEFRARAQEPPSPEVFEALSVCAMRLWNKGPGLLVERVIPYLEGVVRGWPERARTLLTGRAARTPIARLAYGLDLSEQWLTQEDVGTILGSKHITTMRHLDLSGNLLRTDTREFWEMLRPYENNLSTLRLHQNGRTVRYMSSSGVCLSGPFTFEHTNGWRSHEHSASWFELPSLEEASISEQHALAHPRAEPACWPGLRSLRIDASMPLWSENRAMAGEITLGDIAWLQRPAPALCSLHISSHDLEQYLHALPSSHWRGLERLSLVRERRDDFLSRSYSSTLEDDDTIYESDTGWPGPLRPSAYWSWPEVGGVRHLRLGLEPEHALDGAFWQEMMYECALGPWPFATLESLELWAPNAPPELVLGALERLEPSALRRLHLRCGRWGGRELERLATFLSRCTGVEDLALGGNACPETLAPWFAAGARPHALDLSGSHHIHGRALGYLLRTPGLQELRELRLARPGHFDPWHEYDPAPWRWWREGRALPHLRKLMARDVVPLHGLLEMEHWSELTELDVGTQTQRAPENAMRAIAHPSWPKLRRLNVEGRGLQSAELARVPATVLARYVELRVDGLEDEGPVPGLDALSRWRSRRMAAARTPVDSDPWLDRWQDQG